MTSQLRKELNEEKTRKDKITSKAALKWAERNIILINEKIDRRTVKRLSDAIVKFDQSFGAYKEKIPALAAKIERAEEGLDKVLTGRANDKKASDMLARMSFLYSSMSSFFNRDLPIILNTPLFAVPKANPGIRLDTLQASSGAKYDPLKIRDTLRHALTPSKDEQKLLNKIYKKKNVPLLDTGAIANQMLGLSYEELQDLAQMDKVPMVAATEEPPPAPEEDAPQKESANQKKKLTEAENLAEAIDNEKFQTLVKSFKQLQNAVGPFTGEMPETKKALDAIQSTVRKTQTSWSAGKMDQLKKLWGSDVEADIINIYDQFKDFMEVWPNVREVLGDKPTDQPLSQTAGGAVGGTDVLDPEAQDVSNDVRQILTRAISKGFFDFRKPKVSNENFVEEIMKLTPDNIEAIVKAVNLPETAMVVPTDQNQGKETDAEKSTGSVSTDKTAAPAPTAPAKEPAVTQPGTSAGAKQQQQSPEDLQAIAQSIGEKGRWTPENIEAFESTLSTIAKAGYNIVPRG